MATTLAAWTRTIDAALRSGGIDPEPLFVNAGIDPRAMLDPDLRISGETTARLWRASVIATGDEAFGLTVARGGFVHGSPTLISSLVLSPTAWSGLQRLSRFIAIVTGIAGIELTRGSTEVRVRIVPIEAPVAEEAVDALSYSIVRLVRRFKGAKGSPIAVRLKRRSPRQRLSWTRAFRCPVAFASAQDELVFDAAGFDDAVDPGSDSAGARLPKSLIRDLGRARKGAFIMLVRRAVTQALESGEPAGASIARDLGMSLRSFQREMQSNGQTFKQVIDEVRRERASVYLADASLGISDIAFLLGYTHAASFTHAYRRWTGCSPSAGRKAETTAELTVGWADEGRRLG